jgi:hypothetical protein
VVFDWIDKDK